jgi:small GTP-binding protein
MAFNYIYKFLIIGDEAVGKTSICTRMVGEQFKSRYDHTIGVEFSVCYSKIYDNIVIKSQLWDTSGKQVFLPIIDSYFKGVIAVILVYDVSNRRSFDRIDFWLNKIKKRCDDELKVFLIGNKIDLKREVSKEEGQQKAIKEKITFFETSAKHDGNIDFIKRTMCKVIYDNIDPKEPHPGIKLPTSLKLKEPEEYNYNDCCCCC